MCNGGPCTDEFLFKKRLYRDLNNKYVDIPVAYEGTDFGWFKTAFLEPMRAGIAIERRKGTGYLGGVNQMRRKDDKTIGDTIVMRRPAPWSKWITPFNWPLDYRLDVLYGSAYATPKNINWIKTTKEEPMKLFKKTSIPPSPFLDASYPLSRVDDATDDEVLTAAQEIKQRREQEQRDKEQREAEVAAIQYKQKLDAEQKAKEKREYIQRRKSQYESSTGWLLNTPQAEVLFGPLFDLLKRVEKLEQAPAATDQFAMRGSN